MYRLTTDELLYCIRIGNQRQDTNTKNHIASKQFTKRDPTNIHIQGVIGEYTFAHICNRELKTTTDPKTLLDNTSSRGSKHDTFDWIVNTKKIDVKTTLSPYARNIYARCHKKINPADVYALMFIGFFDVVTQKPIVTDMQHYDQLMWMVQAKPADYIVEGHFKGFCTHEQMFQHPMKDGSYMTAVEPKWSVFAQEISSQKPNVVVE